MIDVILVLNAGSSSIKFSVFVGKNSELDLAFRGQVEGLFTSPHFVAKDAAGAVIKEKSWADGTALGHAGAIEYLREFLRERRGDMKLVGVGHRVVHGGSKYFQPARIDKQVISDLEQI